jgi:hypothetical protein
MSEERSYPMVVIFTDLKENEHQVKRHVLHDHYLWLRDDADQVYIYPLSNVYEISYPLSGKAEEEQPEVEEDTFTLKLTNSDVIHLSLALSVSNNVFRNGHAEMDPVRPGWARDGELLGEKIEAQVNAQKEG